MSYIITINRLCGSGGSDIGKKVAERLNIDYYNKKLLRLASDDSGINEQLFAQADEKVKKSLLYRVSKGAYKGELIPPESGNFTKDQNLFNYQAKVLKELADKESFIIIGRCGDFILRDYPNLIKIFITAPEDYCAQRVSDNMDISLKDAYAHISKINKQRSEYYKYYTAQSWSHAGNYDLCLNAASLSDKQSVDFITDYVNKRLGIGK